MRLTPSSLTPPLAVTSVYGNEGFESDIEGIKVYPKVKLVRFSWQMLAEIKLVVQLLNVHAAFETLLFIFRDLVVKFYSWFFMNSGSHRRRT